MRKDIGEAIKNKDYIQGELVWYGFTFSPDIKVLPFVPLADIHYGNPLFSERHLDRTIKYILDTPNCKTFLGGDLFDCVLKSSVGDIYHQIGSPQEQRDWLLEKLYPIKDRILGAVSGNHDRRLTREVGVDFISDIAKEFHIPYRDEGLKIRVTFGRGANGDSHSSYTYSIYYTHGYGGARTDGARIAKIQRTSTFVNADLYCMSHDHQVQVQPSIYLEDDPRSHIDKDTGFRMGKVVVKPKMLVKTNAYIKWGGHGEINGFAPVSLIAPKVRFMGDKREKEIIVEVSSG